MKSAAAILVCGILCCTCGCTKHLSRTDAKAQLEARIGKPEGKVLLSKIGITGNCGFDGLKNYDSVERSAEIAALVAAGYVTVSPIKSHIWNVQLTQIGKQAVEGEKYGHEQNADCDEWQVSIPLSKYDHLEVNGIVEEGAHARVDTGAVFVITPAGSAVRKVAREVSFSIDKLSHGQDLAEKFRDSSLEQLLGSDLANLPLTENTYLKSGSVNFDRFDDGWKISPEQK